MKRGLTQLIQRRILWWKSWLGSLKPREYMASDLNKQRVVLTSGMLNTSSISLLCGTI